MTGYPPGFLESIDRAMAVLPAARFQTAADWLRVLSKPQDHSDKKVVLLRRMPAAEISTQQGQRPLLLNHPVGETAVAAAGASAEDQGCFRRHLRTQSDQGFLGGWLVDSDSGFVMAEEGGRHAFDHQTTISANVGVARANFKALDSLKRDDRVDDILISLSKELHLIRPLERTPKVFLCVALDKESANPGLARVQMKRVEQSVRL